MTFSGQWSGEMPFCELYACVATAVPHGWIVEDVIPLGQSSQVLCEEGYELQGMYRKVSV